MKNFPFYKQPDAMDCGPTCLRIIAKHYGKHFTLQSLRKLSETTREGSSLLGISEAAENIGFHTIGVKITEHRLRKEAPLPCILHWRANHFVVLYKIKKGKYYISDPAQGLLTYTKEEFIRNWIGVDATETTEEGIVLLIEPTPKFYQQDDEEEQQRKSFGFLFQYVRKYKQFVFQLAIGLLAGSLLQLIFPFLTQSIVDIGIQNQDINFIYLILIGQLLLFLGRIAISVIRGWILLHLSTRINISLVSDFFIKLMKLPINFFDVKMTGDILQRINDHTRIERLLTNDSLNTLFSILNLIVLSIVLAIYSVNIFLVFAVGSIFYVVWVLFFLKRRKKLDYKRFAEVSQEQSKVIEMINGMQEIKLHNAERQKRWGWEYVQARLFKVAMKSLALEQTQSVGASFINELKNILITVLSATLVISGNITLGMMMAIQYIIGQLNNPISQLVGFIQSTQDAKISLERLNEIHEKEEEESADQFLITEIPKSEDLIVKDVSFRYVGSPELVLKDIDVIIPSNKTTAIVGISGSGKTTLMKLLLKFYEPTNGEINLGNFHLANISPGKWRSVCGVVMQEGYIFNDTIANNIAIGSHRINKNRLIKAVDTANIKSFIENLPLAYNTKIGNEGVGLSTGQKQRLLIARAVYKNPDYLFFDEATSALDANNEKVIMEKLNHFFKNKTVVVIAHRLSTVRNADQIIVLEGGKQIEQGNHKSLVEEKGAYFELVRNQLELGG